MLPIAIKTKILWILKNKGFLITAPENTAVNLRKFINHKNDINHIALVLPDVEHTANKLKQYGFQVGQISFFEAEGTKEIYIESEKSASLLLMQPTKEGSYQKALNKRGPSLHHIAIDVIDLEISI